MKKVVVLGNALGLLVSGGIILKYIYTLMILPFIIKEVTSMTWIGLFVLIIAICCFVENYNYFKENFKEKRRTKNEKKSRKGGNKKKS